VIGFDHIAGLWEEGQRRVREADPPLRLAMERVVDELVLELRRRVGGKFTADELAAYYLSNGTDWCFEIAYRTAPNTPEAWDLATVAGAAFARYVRQAMDYGGGLRRELEE
jgi:hypothetical protein